MVPRRAAKTTTTPADGLLEGWCRYAESPRRRTPGRTGAEDAERMLESLRWLERRLERCVRGRIESAVVAEDPVDVAPPPSLGACCRQLVAWIQEHPERANEPPEWLIRDVLEGRRLGAGAGVEARNLRPAAVAGGPARLR